MNTTDFTNMDNRKLNQKYNKILNTMNKKLYGMEKVKLKLLEIYNDRLTSNYASRRNIGLIGAPGLGKTQIGKVWASVLGVPFQKVSVGGLNDSSFLKGSNKVWNSADPSIALQILSQMKVADGIIMFDEVDKLGKEAQYALLHISDTAHNQEFRDTFLKRYPHDLSKVLFIYCLNDASRLDSALLDRLDLIEIKPYTINEKKIIFNEYMLPEALENVQMKSTDIILNEDALNYIVTKNGTESESGVRYIEKAVKSIVGKVNLYRKIVLTNKTTGSIKLPYTIPNFKLPLKIDLSLAKLLTED